MNMPTVSMTLVIQLMRYASYHHLDPVPVLCAVGLDPSVLTTPDARCAFDTYLRLQEALAEVANDENLGLHMGQCAESRTWSIMGYIMMNCETIGDALKRAENYSGIVSNVISLRLDASAQSASLRLESSLPVAALTRHCIEATLSSLVHIIEHIAKQDIPLTLVTMTHEPPANLDDHRRIFRCPLRFSQPSNQLVFPASFLKTPIAYQNPALLQAFEQYASSLLAKINGEASYSGKVTEFLMKRLPDGAPSVEDAADALAMSVRSLQLRLEEEGATFRGLLRQARETMAQSYLKEKRCSISEITYLLGFSEPSVFRRTFKQWTGLTPGEYRLRQTL